MVAMGMPGPMELIVVLVIILLLFGAKKLPEMARSLGKSSNEFKRGLEEVGGGGASPSSLEPQDKPE